MKYSEMDDYLLKIVPELKAVIELKKAEWGNVKVPTYVLYEEILNVYVYKLLLANKDKIKINNIFNFYEKMAVSEDGEVRNLLQVALLEYLWTNRDIRDTAVCYMHTNTKKLLEDVKEIFS